MKVFLTTIALCVSLVSIATGDMNTNTVTGIWVSNNYESLIIMDTIAYFETNADRHMFHYILRGDSLVLFSPYSIQGDSLVPFQSDTMSDNYFQPEDTGGFCFIIEHRDSDSMVLRPYRSSTREQFKHSSEDDYLFDSTNTITLYSILKDTLLSFDRLLFYTHSSNRFEHGLILRIGSKGEIVYPPGKLIERDLRIIIDSTKTMYLYGNNFAMQLWGLYKYGNKNALKQGYYQGCLSDSLYRRLIDLLKTSSLDRMRFKKDPYDSTGPKYTLDIYYNGKYKRTEGTDAPLIGYRLVTYLSSVATEVPLVKSKTAKKMFEQFYKTRDK